MMTRLDRLILSELIGPFFGSAFLFTALFFAGGELVRYAEFLQKGESFLVVAQLMWYTLPGVIAFTFPMAMLLASLLGFGRLSGDSEITAITAAGCSFERTVAPVAAMGLAVSLVGVWFYNSVVPDASKERNRIIDRVKREGSIVGTRLSMPQRDHQGNLVAFVQVEGNANLADGELTRVGITLWEKGRIVGAISAPRAVWKQGKNWILHEARTVTWDESGIQVADSDNLQTVEQQIETPEKLKAFVVDGRPEDFTSDQLRSDSRTHREAGNLNRARELEVKLAERNSVPFAAFAFGLVGAALGVRSSREGRGVGFGFSVIITFLYYVGLNVVSILARNGVMPANFALMLPNLIGLAVAIFLIRRVMR